MAYIHFCIFKKFWGKDGLRLTRWTTRELLEIKGLGLNVLVGLPPSNNKLARKFNKRTCDLGGRDIQQVMGARTFKLIKDTGMNPPKFLPGGYA